MKSDMARVYLDHNATTPIDQGLKELVPTWLNSWGNPSSIHQDGRGPKALMREARLNVAKILGVDPLEVVFTSGASESNNTILKGLWLAKLAGKKEFAGRNKILVSKVEHPSVTQTAEWLEKMGMDVIWIPVDREGRLDLEFLEKNLSSEVLVVSVMLANNETGALMPVEAVSKLVRPHGVLFHCDAVQGLGRIPIKLREWGIDFASFSAHKFYALKGTGVLYIRKGLSLENLIHGGGQERFRRAGTENTIGIAALGHMCSKHELMQEKYLHMKALRDGLERQILLNINGVRITSNEVKRLPNTSHMVIDGVDGESLLMNLDLQGFSVSTGAACSSGSPEPSPVLMAMGFKYEEAQSSLRLSVGWFTTQDEVDRFVETLKSVVDRLREKAAYRSLSQVSDDSVEAVSRAVHLSEVSCVSQ